MAQITTRKRGNYWEYSFEISSINGKRKRKSKSGFKTKKECLEAGAKAKAEYDSTGDVFEQSDISLVDYMNFWLDDYVGCRILSIGLCNSFRHHLLLNAVFHCLLAI